MKIADFIEASELHDRMVNRLFIPIVCAFPFAIIYLFFRKDISSIASGWYDQSIGEFIALLPLILLLIAVFAAMVVFNLRVQDKYGVLCHQCNEPLTRYRSIVVASKHCPHCGQQVITDD